jgi:hypothetical protein
MCEKMPAYWRGLLDELRRIPLLGTSGECLRGGYHPSSNFTARLVKW